MTFFAVLTVRTVFVLCFAVFTVSIIYSICCIFVFNAIVVFSVSTALTAFTTFNVSTVSLQDMIVNLKEEEKPNIRLFIKP